MYYNSRFVRYHKINNDLIPGDNAYLSTLDEVIIAMLLPQRSEQTITNVFE